MTKELSTYKHLLVLTGLAFIFSAYLWYLDIRLSVNNFAFTEGTVVDLEYSPFAKTDAPNAVIHFSDSAGKWTEHIVNNSELSTELLEGDSVNIMYPTHSPRSAIVYNNFDLWGGPLFIISLGLGLLLLGISFLVHALIEQRQILKAASKTTHLQTMFVNVEKNRGNEIEGHRPYCIYSQWRDPKTSEVHFFQSEDLWTDPSEYIKGRKITVFVKNNNLNEYSVDLSFLPERIINDRSRLYH